MFHLGLILLFIALLANYVQVVVDGLLSQSLYALDFKGYYDAARAIILGENPYTYYQKSSEFRDLGLLNYGYPPMFAAALTPLAHQSIATAQAIWLVANQVFFVAAALLSIRICRCRFSRWQLLLIGCIMLGFYPIYPNLKLGNVSMLLYVLAALTYYFWQRGNRTLAAFCLGLGMALKLVPILIALYLLWKKEHLLVVKAVLFAALLAALPDLFFGTHMLEYYLSNFFEIVDVLDNKPLHVDNQSIYGFLSRLSNWLTHTQAASEVIYWLDRILSLLGFASILYLSPRSRQPSNRTAILELGLVLFLFPLFSNNSYTHYYTWILLMAPALVYLLWNQVTAATKPRDYLLPAAAVIGFAFMSQPYRIPRLMGYNVQVDSITLDWFGLLLQSLLVYGALLIVGVTAALLTQKPGAKQRAGSELTSFSEQPPT